MSAEGHDPIERDVRELLQDFERRFDRVSLLGPTAHPRAGTRFELISEVPGTARVVIYPSNDEVNLWVGEHTGVELPRGRKSEDARLQDLRAILEAIVSGRFEETAWKRHGKTVRVVSTFYKSNGEKLLKIRRFAGLRDVSLFERGERSHVKYQPY